jgi:gamma-glutamylcyclotransferase (GGCT)/AIG2-like uncharacterized protein YtfP
MRPVNNIFVYGTLKQELLGEVMPHIKPYIEFGDKGYVKGRLFDLGEFPGAKPTRLNNKKVQGQLLSIKPGFESKVLNELDEYEEYNPSDADSSLFKRKKVKVFTKGTLKDAWIYWYNKPVSKKDEINDGVYKTPSGKLTSYVID